jgi:PAS domain S-box-containing protein
MRVSASQALLTAHARQPAMLIAIGGAAITLLLAGIVMTLTQSRQRLRERLEADFALAQREQQASQVLENTLDAYIAIDPLDRILEWNRQAEAVFGWTSREAIGKRLTETLVPPSLRRRHYDAIIGYADRPTHPLLGQRLEMPAVRKDGTQITVELSIIEISAPNGRSFAASLRDITETRRREREVRELNEKLELRVAERTGQLEVANRSLSAANRELEAFTYTVSHDLRAPLRAIDGHVQRLTDQTELMSDTMKHHAAAVRRNVTRMNQLIDDLLNFAFISRKPLVKQRVALWDVVRPILHELQTARPILYEVSPDSLGVVRADPALLAQAMTNLLSNAAKFSRNKERPRIAVGSEKTSNGRVYYVQDNGVGFDMQYSEKLFGVFERLHNSREFEGTGVGLAIVKQIIERHGGRIWAESEPGCGATFRFTLPDEEAA